MATQAEAVRARIGQAYQNVGSHCFPVVEFALVKLSIDYKVFDMIPDEGDISVAELASKVGGEQELVDRIATFFIAAGILESPKQGTVAHTARSRLYKSNEPTAWLYIHVFNNIIRPVVQFPAFFAKHGLASPKSPRVTPIGLAFGYEDKAVYDILVADAKTHKGFNNALRELGAMYSLKGVYDFRWMQGAVWGLRPAIIDVGGSSGFALRDAIRNNPFIPAEKCVLYDLPQVIENTKNNLDESLRTAQLVAGDMFEPYPENLRGALVYQFRRVFNDFPDDDVVRALQSVRKAVGPDSRVLVIEEMLSTKPNVMNVTMDIALMCAAGKRRNAAMFKELAERAGFSLNAEFHKVADEFDDFSVLEFVAA